MLNQLTLPNVYSMFIEDFLTEDAISITNELNQHLSDLKISKEEQHSWWKTIECLQSLMQESKVNKQAVIAFEYRVPLTHLRIDVLLTGKNKNGDVSLIVIEMKQWEHWDGQKDPCIQAEGYSNLLKDYNKYIVEQKINPTPIVYTPRCSDYIAQDKKNCVIFGANQKKDLLRFLEEHLAYGDDNAEIYCNIVRSDILSIPQICEMVPKMIEGDFPLIDEQRLALNEILNAVEEKGKHFISIKGEPGTGKSVIAMNALSKLVQKGKRVCYANPIHDMPLRWILLNEFNKYRSGSFRPMFMDTNEILNQENYDVIIMDEAHKMVYNKHGKNAEMIQLMNKTQVLVLLGDVCQANRPYDIFIDSYFEKIIRENAPEVSIHPNIDLQVQFRCNGAQHYTQWLRNLLYNNVCLDHLETKEYPFIIYDDPEFVKKEIVQRQKEGYRARLLIGDAWTMDKSRKSVLPKTFEEPVITQQLPNIWANDEHFSLEYGTSNTCAGLEFDYVGVFVMQDIVFENNEVTSHPERNQNLYIDYRNAALYDWTFAMIKNTYYALLTRGIKGCYVYIHNKPLREYFRQHIIITK